METIDSIIKLLQDIKAEHGNLEVGETFYSEDYPTEIMIIKPGVITNPVDKNKSMVVFD